MQTIGRQHPQAPEDAAVHHERPRPEETTPCRLAQQPAASFIARTETGGGSELPRFIKDEVDAFLERGILARGGLRLRCGERDHDKRLTASCKRHGSLPAATWQDRAHSAARALTTGIVALEADPVRTQSMTGFNWITYISLNAT